MFCDKCYNNARQKLMPNNKKGKSYEKIFW